MSLFDFNIIRRTQRDVAEKLAVLAADIKRLEAERGAILDAPVTRQEVMAFVPGVIRKTAEDFERQCAETVGGLNRPRDFNHLRAETLLRDLLFPQSGGSATQRSMSPSAICALFGSAAEESMRVVIGKMAWPEGAAPMAGRDVKVTGIDAKLAELKRQHEGLMREAREAGLEV